MERNIHTLYYHCTYTHNALGLSELEGAVHRSHQPCNMRWISIGYISICGHSLQKNAILLHPCHSFKLFTSVLPIRSQFYDKVPCKCFAYFYMARVEQYSGGGDCIHRCSVPSNHVHIKEAHLKQFLLSACSYFLMIYKYIMFLR